MNFCPSGGYLVGADDWLPTSAFDYFGVSYGTGNIGCNRLVCSRCKQAVRHELGYGSVPPLDAATLFSTPRWSDTQVARPSLDQKGRLYVCECATHLILGSAHLDTGSDGDPDVVPPWRCDGHPRFTPPGSIADIDLPAFPNWHSVVAANLELTSRLHPAVDCIPGFRLTRIFRALERDIDRQALGVAVGSYGIDASLRSRQAVALFFALNGDAPGFEQVLDAWRAAPARYENHPTAFGPYPLLKDDLLAAIAKRLAREAPNAAELLATWRWAALHGSGLGVHLHRAALMDAAWVNENVEELFDVAPADWATLLLSTHVDPPTRLLAGCRAAIAHGHASREEVVAALAQEYGDSAAPAITALTQPAPE